MDFSHFDAEQPTRLHQSRPAPAPVSSQAVKKMRVAQENRGIVTQVEVESVEHEYNASSHIKREDTNITSSTSTVAADKNAVKLEDATIQAQQPAQPLTNATAETTEEEQVKPLVLTHQVRHQVAIPNNYPFVPLSHTGPSANPARSYPFTLDPFQQLAIQCIERAESVLVSAHTSAGKTVVAEYAIAVALRDKQRVIYTSPIKALSNQKYRELSQEFGDVGLMTGDVTINPSASCLVMTTEILRSMLYRGSEVMREVSFVIFDEIHYMRDKNRGVVWEECIIMLDDKVKFVFLSATIPNAMQFAEWICGMHGGPCHVVYTDYRPTPLQHYLFPQNGDGIYLAVDEKGQFREDNFQKAVSGLQDSEGNKQGKGGKGGKIMDKAKGEVTDLFKIVKMIMQKNYHPVIVFSFSKKECESNALQLSKLAFNDPSEKDLVTSVFENAISSLGVGDRSLPQIQHILPLLQRGIGIHHSGLLPILKEVIEILFQEGLLKVLFATETFSIGLNMPARTVVFTNVKKWDGKETRWLGGGEYIQMSGRAGRRGLDDRGIVILMLDAKMEPAVAKQMLKGEADRLDSAFYLGYSMILNLIRVEGVAPEYMLERCFLQFQACDKVPDLERDIQILQQRVDQFVIQDERDIEQYHVTRSHIKQLRGDVRDVVNHPTYCLAYLQPGRLVKITLRGGQAGAAALTTGEAEEREDDLEEKEFGWGAILNFQKRVVKAKDTGADLPVYLVDILLRCAKGTEPGTKTPALPGSGAGEMCVVVVELRSIDTFSSVRINIPKDCKSRDARECVGKVIVEVEKRCGGVIPVLDAVKDMGITDKSFVTLHQKIEVLETTLKASAFAAHPDHTQLYTDFLLKLSLHTKIRSLQKQVNQAHSIIQLDELKCRRRVLRRLGYISQTDVIELKGRVACEITAGDELLLTEMIFQGAFNELTVEQTVTLLSCFTWQEKSTQSKIRDDLAAPFKSLQQTAQHIAQISLESKLVLNPQLYLDQFRPELFDLVHAWCSGQTFSEVMTLTDAFEGSVIRCMRNLEELLRQMCCAARAIGNEVLEAKFEEGIGKIKRDIVFAASLYL